jgi:N6-adenosine-specific RNA methylase IME4/DNA-binding XRE family transcriptional regulator
MRTNQLKSWKEMQECLPGLSSEEQRSLKRSLKEHSGVEIPVLALPDGRVIDGHHRLRLGDGKCKIQILDLPEEKALALGIALNIARRQLSSEQLEHVREQLSKKREVRKETALELRKEGKTQKEAAAAVGVAKQTVAEWERKGSKSKNRLASPPPGYRVTVPREKHKEILKRKKRGESSKKIADDYKVSPRRIDQIAGRAQKAEKKKNPRQIQGKYRIFYADPPWQYRDSGQVTEADNYGKAERHYRTMSIDELCGMGEQIKKVSTKDAVLFLWVTSPLLEECFAVIKAWGFKYKSSFVWDKMKHNYGHYNSVRHEFLLICTRGSCTPDEKKKLPSIISIERSRSHSEKPERFRAIIDRLYRKGNRIELFSRKKTIGWEAWGDQA